MAPLCLCHLRDAALLVVLFCVVLLHNKGLALDLLNKPAYQSTSPYGEGPSRAIDGDRNTWMHTGEGAEEWWMVDLEDIYCLKKITVINRPSPCCLDRLEGAVVRAGLSADIYQNTQIGSPITLAQADAININFIVDPVVSAQYVSVELNASVLLHISEVMVEEIQDTEETSGIVGSVEFTLVANPAQLGATGDNDATLVAYKSPTDTAAAVAFGRRLETGGSNANLPIGSSGFYDANLGCTARLLRLPLDGGIDRTGVFYATATRNGMASSIHSVILPQNGNIYTRPVQRTQRVSIGESVTLRMEGVGSPNTNYRWKHNADNVPKWNDMLNVTIENITVTDGGVYSCFADSQESQQRHGFMKLIVRECAMGMWGQDSCQNTCHRCYNGGICDDKKGTCICAPGFSGQYCQQVHGRNVFGQTASHTCSGSSDPHDNACQGRLFCLLDPYGCSCAAGYTGLDCMQECSEMKYGADCKETCHCESGYSCKNDTGECTGNCIPPYFESNCQCSTSNGILGLGVLSTDPYQLHVSWQPDPCVSGYILEIALTNRGQCDEIVSPHRELVPGPFDAQTTSHVITGLISRSTYMVYIRPQYNDTQPSQGPDASTSGTTLRRNNPTSADPLNITSVDSDSVTLGWREVLCSDNYLVQFGLSYKDGCQPITPVTYTQHCTCFGTTLTTIPSLIAYSTYDIKVNAHVDGTSGPVAQISVTTGIKEPSAPPQEITVTSKKRSLTFSWNKPACGSRGGVITGYMYKLIGPGSQLILDVTSGERVEIVDLIPYNNYSFQVAANTSVGAGPYSDVVVQRTNEAQPTVPLNVAIQNVDDVSITLKWSEPDPPQGIITNYIIRYWRSGQSGNKQDTNDVFQLMHEITDLGTNVTYYLQVQAETSIGRGPWSAEVNATTIIGVPGPVHNLRSTNTNESSISLDWEEPLKPKGRILYYIVKYKMSLSDDYERDEVMKSTITKNGLNPATAYEFTITAQNQKFEGSPTILVVYTKPQSNPATPPKPRSFANEATDTTVTIGLAKPTDGGQFVESYVVRVKKVELKTKRDVLEPNRFEDSPGDYIAAEFPAQDAPNKFTVGDTNIYGGYYNARLTTGDTYEISTGSVSRGNETKGYVSYSESLTVRAQTPSQVGVIVAVVVIVVIVALGLVVGSVVYKRRRASQGKGHSDESDIPLNEKASTLTADGKSSTNNYVNDGAAVSETTNTHNPKPPPKPRQKQTAPKPPVEDEVKEQVEFVPPPAVRREELAEYNRQKEAAGENGFLADYKSLPEGQLHPWTVAAKPENKAKNRYINVIAYDHSRVVLEPLEGDPHSDYINACYINGYKARNKYVASQGANKASINDIWRMVWQLGIDKIVMLTNPVENGKMKCLQYWADTGSTAISNILITTEKEEIFLDYTIRHFLIQQVGSEVGSRPVKQFHYTTWPDMKPPEYPAPLLNFMRLVNAHHNTGRVMVHCSAGVGRTGTFIALDAMQEQMAKEGQVDVLNFVYQMRQNRIKMVQTPDQYKFIYDALLAASVTGDTTYSVADFRQKLTALKKKDKGAKETGLQKQFATLIQLSDRQVKVEKKSGQLAQNNDKNRYPDFIPSDRSRPFLFTRIQEDETNYINATFLPGYRKKNMYIGTQMPMPNTVTDFWRMMYDHKATSIVMLNTLNANDKTMCRYWPEEGSIHFGQLSIKLVETKESKSVTRCYFTLKNTKNEFEEARTITQFQYHDWPADQELPSTVAGMLTLMELTRKESEDKGPIVVHCMDGLGSTSVYCTLMALLEQFNVEKVVDVFQAAHRLRMVNQNMMYSEGHYALCYDVIQAMLDSTTIYENFTHTGEMISV